jgi:hypothetical protein
MIIITKNKKKILNFESIQEIIKLNGEERILVKYKNGESFTLERYVDEHLADIAMEILCNKISSNFDIITMPTEQEVKAYIVNNIKFSTNNGHNGHKRKNHGGS